MAKLPVAIAWIDRADWEEAKRWCSGLQEHYDDWLKNAEDALAEFSEGDFAVFKVVIKPDQFKRRYRTTGRKVDAKDRSEMAARMLGDMNGGGTQN